MEKKDKTLKVIKRAQNSELIKGSIVDFNSQKIVDAIEKAMEETKLGMDNILSRKIADEIESEAKNRKDYFKVDEIQDLVEEKLMLTRPDVAKKYMIYRYERDKKRVDNPKTKTGLLSEEFLSKYKHAPSPMNQLGSFTYYRTYSRWLPEEKRREYWWETVLRAVEYNCSLIPNVSVKEAEKLYDNIFNLRQFLSGRTLWSGGSGASKKYPLANYNCAFTTITKFEDFRELFYLLMIGAGVGVRVLEEDVITLPEIRTDMKIINEDYFPVYKHERVDFTSLKFSNTSVEIIVGDSKEGWMEALDTFFKLHYSKEYRNIDTIIINYNMVRPKGEKLNTFGGTASGHESLRNMFVKISRVLNSRSENQWKKLNPVDCLDIANIIGENVVSGGVRRTSEIVIGDATNEEFIEAKSNLYTKTFDEQGNEKWDVNPLLIHRSMSNNSIFYREKPFREKLHEHFIKMRYSGEPGWVNEEVACKRRPDFKGVNPCGEILLDSKGLCNLTTVNVLAFVRDGALDKKELFEAMKLSARAGLRMTCLDLEFNEWDIVQKRDRLIGCSMTGWQDAMNILGLDKDEQASLLKELREVVHNYGNSYADELGINRPLLMTTIKPEGTLSLLPTVSSGVHFSHSPYYIRRVRISADDPLAKVALELKGWVVHPEVNQTWENAKTLVVEFPVKAPEGKTKYDVSALEQLENYKMFMENYIDHNCSITVHVREHEWKEVEQWVWDNWDIALAMTFIPLDDSFYALLPYEAITKEEYEKRISEMQHFIPSLITKYELNYQEYSLESVCAGGACPIR